MSNDIELLCQLFGWDFADVHVRYMAMRVLLLHREPAVRLEDFPTFDDFVAGRVR